MATYDIKRRITTTYTKQLYYLSTMGCQLSPNWRVLAIAMRMSLIHCFLTYIKTTGMTVLHSLLASTIVYTHTLSVFLDTLFIDYIK